MGEYGDLEDNEPEYQNTLWTNDEDRLLNSRFKQMTLATTPLVEVVDLFAGGGGFTEGAIRAGANVVLSIDCWEPAIEIHKANHPKVPMENLTLGGSIIEVAEYIRSRLTLGAHFHLHGSPPCQKLSNASSGDSEEGMVLVNWFIDLVKHMQPDSWSMENVVPVARKIDIHRPGTPYVKLNSADFGVPQTRNRIFAGEGWIAEPTHTKEEWVSVIEALPHLEEELSSNDRIVSRRRKAGEEPQAYPPSRPAHTITQVTHIMEDVVVSTVGAGSSISPRAISGDTTIDKPMKTLCNNTPSIRIVLPIQRKIGILKKNGRVLQPLWREKEEPINTITSLTPTVGSLPAEATRDNPMKATKIRSLTLAETAVLQGFNPDMKLPYKRKKDAWTVLGNAVCPPVAEAIIRGLIV